MKSIPLGIMTILLVACASTPPVKHSFESSKVYHADYDKVWESIIEAFARNNIPIKTLDKNSGLVVSEDQYIPFTTRYGTKIVDAEYCDCGGGGSLRSYSDLSGKFNVFVKKLNGSDTAVQVNAFFKARVNNDLSGVPIGWQNCASTGAFEAKLFSVLDANLSK
jgi:hypothetical protein